VAQGLHEIVTGRLQLAGTVPDVPATFPSHAGAVLPLKLWRPDWFDGVALVVGAALPDLVYVGGCCGPPFTAGHTWRGVVVGVPVTVVLAAIVRRAAPGVVAHLPSLRTVALGDYAVLGAVRHPWWISASSALLGAASHVGWDHVTHASIAGTGLGLSALGREVSGTPLWMPLHLASSALGALLWLAVTVHIGRRRLLVRWHGPAPVVATRPVRFWATAVTTGVLGLAAVAVSTLAGQRHAMVDWLPPVPRPVVLVTRVSLVVVTALCVAAVAVGRTGGTRARGRTRRASRRPDPAEHGGTR
jgi:hypothetical protein